MVLVVALYFFWSSNDVQVRSVEQKRKRKEMVRQIIIEIDRMIVENAKPRLMDDSHWWLCGI